MPKPKAATKPDPDPDGAKRVLTGIYRDRDQTLFVPTLKMYDARQLLADASKRGEAVSISTVNRRIGVANALRRWAKLYADVPWFDTWLKGADAPKNVYVVSEVDLRKARMAWGYGDILRGIAARKGRHPYPFDYLGFYAYRCRFPVEQIGEFVRWLYGGPQPAGWLILPEWVVHLRHELTPEALCTAADLDHSNYWRWKRTPLQRQALLDAVATVRAGRGRGAPRGSQAWDVLFGARAKSSYRDARTPSPEIAEEARRRLGAGTPIRDVARALGISIWRCKQARRGRYHEPKIHRGTVNMADSMLRFARAASEGAAMRRVKAKLGECGDLAGLRSKATEAGCLAALNDYINDGLTYIGKDFVMRQPGRRGVVAPGLYLPTPLMQEFRAAAMARWTENQLSFVTRTPCFKLWFLDWTLPLATRGRVSPYRQAVGLLAPTGPYRNDPAALTSSAAADSRPPQVEPESPPSTASMPDNREPLVDSGTTSSPASSAQTNAALKLTEMERNILEAASDQAAIGKVLAVKAGYPFHSKFRTTLRNLFNRGLLLKGIDGTGYRRVSK